MTDQPVGNPSKPRNPTDEPGYVDGIPVEELVRVTREFTARITNEDRQRVTREMVEGGKNIQTGAPNFLQQFFAGRIDLDVALMRRFPGSPLLTSPIFDPPIGKQARYGVAYFASQDDGASLGIELHGAGGEIELRFLHNGMLGIRFLLESVPAPQRKRFLDLLRRNNVIAFLWTKERWEKDYVIFVVRERFARLYAFGGERYEATCRLTPDGLDQLVDWMRGFWALDNDGTADDQAETEEEQSDINW